MGQLLMHYNHPSIPYIRELMLLSFPVLIKAADDHWKLSRLLRGAEVL